MEETKICKHCKEIVNASAKKCPHCTGDLRSWFRRHPILTFFFGMFIFGSIISASSDNEKQNTNMITDKTNKTDIKITLPVMDLYGKNEETIKSTFSNTITDYLDTGLTPSKKIKITGFDIKNTKINVQIDYSIQSGEPYYVGYSFSEKPLSEEDAWEVVGFEKPQINTQTNHGIMNSEVYFWENTDEIKPFKLIQVIYNANGSVGKISFAMEDLETAMGDNSLYSVPISR